MLGYRINRIRGNDPERSIHGTSASAFDSAHTLDMCCGIWSETRCHNWGVARATDRHNEETAQSGSGFPHFGGHKLKDSSTICSSLAKARMKIILRTSKGRVCARERGVIRDMVVEMGPSYCAAHGDSTACKGGVE